MRSTNWISLLLLVLLFGALFVNVVSDDNIDIVTKNEDYDNINDESEGCGCSGPNGLTRDSVSSSTLHAINNNINNDNNNMNSISVNENNDENENGKVEEKVYKKDHQPKLASWNRVKHLQYLDSEMVFIPGGTFYMGSDNPIIKTDGEGPRRQVSVSDFLMDKYEVSNDKYEAFVRDTGYVTDSEVYGWSFVFDSAVAPHIKENIDQAVLGAEWWLPVNGSYWRQPEGPGSDVFNASNWRGNYPATQISWTDADRYCRWRGARLPTEAEWERAAHGTQSSSNGAQTMFPWGNKLTPNRKHRANIWQGEFPHTNTADDGFVFMSPVDAYPPQNDFGLHNMIGNVWEWVEDWFTVSHNLRPPKDYKGPRRGVDKVKRGGSFLCHRSFCYRYRSVARYATTPDSATLNSGLRCAKGVPVGYANGDVKSSNDKTAEL